MHRRSLLGGNQQEVAQKGVELVPDQKARDPRILKLTTREPSGRNGRDVLRYPRTNAAFCIRIGAAATGGFKLLRISLPQQTPQARSAGFGWNALAKAVGVPPDAGPSEPEPAVLSPKAVSPPERAGPGLQQLDADRTRVLCCG
jgi:hypothetical protein